jgi:CheY-like chemotaxis protein
MIHVLVVEDDPVNALLFRSMLERRGGWRVTVTEDVGEILRMVRAGETALVVMDISLANSTWQGHSMSGVDICVLIKSDPATAHVPVLLATAHAMRGDRQRLLAESGADDYVPKPIVDQDAFVTLVRNQLERRRAA